MSQIPLALVLVSVKWWENFVDTDRGCLRLFAFKRVCKDARTKMDCVTSLVSIFVTIGLVYLLEYLDGKTLTYGFLYGYSSINGNLAILSRVHSGPIRIRLLLLFDNIFYSLQLI